MSKTILNSLILRNNDELKSIMIKKGQIYRELSYFWGISSNSVNPDNELKWKIRKFSRFQKIT